MQSVLDKIEQEDSAAIETARQQYRDAVANNTVDRTPAKTISRWLELLKISTTDVRADQQAARQLKLLQSELPGKADIAGAVTEQQQALERLKALELEQLTEMTKANNALNAAGNRRNQLERKAKVTAQQIADLKRENPRIF